MAVWKSHVQLLDVLPLSCCCALIILRSNRICSEYGLRSASGGLSSELILIFCCLWFQCYHPYATALCQGASTRPVRLHARSVLNSNHLSSLPLFGSDLWSAFFAKYGQALSQALVSARSATPKQVRKLEADLLEKHRNMFGGRIMLVGMPTLLRCYSYLIVLNWIVIMRLFSFRNWWSKDL